MPARRAFGRSFSRRTGQLVAEGSRPTPIARPRPGWAEHDPEALWQAACGALRDALAQLQEPDRVVGIAVASVGEALVTLDAAGQPTGPTIAWYDERPKPELDRLLQTFGAETLYALTGLSADPTFSLLKLLWLQANDPDALARTSMVLNLTHYLAWRLSGVPGIRSHPGLAHPGAGSAKARLGRGFSCAGGRSLTRAAGADPAVRFPARHRHRRSGQGDRPRHPLRRGGWRA